MKLEIRFGRTKSVRLPEAIRQAEKMPGYTKHDRGREVEVVVSTMVPFEDPELWQRIEELIATVGSWQYTQILLDGNVITPWQLTRDLSPVIACYGKKRRTDPTPAYCSGKETPTADISCFGCRLIKGVDVNGGSESRVRWYQFGRLSEDQKRFVVDKDAILARLRHENTCQPCLSCPAFSWEHVGEAVNSLPTEIDLEKSDRFKVKFSALDPSKPSGIEPEYRRLGLSMTLNYRSGPLPQTTSLTRKVPQVFYHEVAAQEEAIEQLRDICELPLKYAEYFTHLGLTPHRGVILCGH